MILIQKVMRAICGASTKCREKVRDLRSASGLASLNRVNVSVTVFKCRTWKEMRFNRDENLYRVRGKEKAKEKPLLTRESGN